MKHLLLKTFTLFIAFVALPSGLRAQLVIDNTQTPQQLVQNVLLGTGVTATNITFTGLTTQIAKFTATNTNLGLTSGVIMVTGPCSEAIGPNISSSTGMDVGPPSFPSPAADHDAQLDAIIQVGSPGVYTNDAAVLEFDFVPTSDTVKFRYVFGSEEYPEFVGSINDVFAFFLNGPGYANTNIALVPGTSTPISIATVNNINNSQYYIDNEFGTTIEFDGFTTTMTAIAAVQCGQSYHIKLAIADASDGVWDSGVFLEAGSFSSTGTVQILPDVSYSTTNDTTMFEGCGDATIYFVRQSNDLTQPMTIDFVLSGTATNGVDYTNIPTQVVIPANDTSTSITINPLADGIPEGIETITFSVTNTVCTNSSTSTVTIYLNDVNPLVVDLGPDQSTACTGGGNVILTADVTGGATPIDYLWTPTGEITQTISVLPAQTTTYTVTASDFCGNTDTDTIDVVVQIAQPLLLTVSNDTLICQNDMATLVANYQGGVGNVTLTWNNGVNTAVQQVSPMVTTTYIVNATDLCNQTITDSVVVDVSANNADFSWVFLDNNTLQFTNESVGYENLVAWDFGDQSAVSNAFSPLHDYANDGTYIVTLIIENTAGCFDTVQYSIVVKPEFYIYIPNAFSPNNDGTNDTFNAKGTGFDVYQMRIYNRWGNLIFETSSLAVGWDGRGTSGKLVPLDIYVYEIAVKIKDGQEPLTYRGKVSMLK